MIVDLLAEPHVNIIQRPSQISVGRMSDNSRWHGVEDNIPRIEIVRFSGDAILVLVQLVSACVEQRLRQNEVICAIFAEQRQINAIGSAVFEREIVRGHAPQWPKDLDVGGVDGVRVDGSGEREQDVVEIRCGSFRLVIPDERRWNALCDVNRSRAAIVVGSRRTRTLTTGSTRRGDGNWVKA